MFLFLELAKNSTIVFNYVNRYEKLRENNFNFQKPKAKTD